MAAQQGNQGQGFNPFNIFRPAQQGSRVDNPNPADDPNANPMAGGQPDPAAGMDPKNKGAGAGSADDPNIAGTKAKGPTSGLDAFSDMFKLDDKKAPAADPLREKLFNVDPQKLAAGVAKLDFSRNLNPEHIKAALAGDSSAFGSVLNSVAQAVFLQSTQAVIGMMEGGISRNNDRFNSILDGRFREFTIQNTDDNHPALKHASVKPVLSAIRQMIASQNPTMSPTEVAQKARDYFLQMGEAINSFNPDGTPRDMNQNRGSNPFGQQQPKEEDWLNFLEGKPGNIP